MPAAVITAKKVIEDTTILHLFISDRWFLPQFSYSVTLYSWLAYEAVSLYEWAGGGIEAGLLNDFSINLECEKRHRQP